MDLFELEEHAMVRSAAGQDLGEIERYVVDPSGRRITHLVVKEGLIFTERRVVAVELIDHVDDRGPVLSADLEPDDLPPFETEHFVPVDEVTRGRFDERVGDASMWRYPTLETGFYPGYPGMPIPYREEPEMTTVRELNVPADSSVVDDRTRVESATGGMTGRVAEVAVDSDGALSHLVVDFDTLEGERLVPGHWIDAVYDDRIVLAVGESALEHLDRPQQRS